MITTARLTSVSDAAVTELAKLAGELRGEDVHVGKESIDAIVADTNAHLMVAKDGERIIGMGTLYVLPKVGKLVSTLEDVVVLGEYRGKGVGKLLMEAILEEAKAAGVRSISLTSRPSRVAAQALYQKLGFTKRETDAFKLSFT